MRLGQERLNLVPRVSGPQAFRSTGGRQERLWGTGILLPQDFCSKTMEASTKPSRDSQSKNFNKITVPQSLS